MIKVIGFRKLKSDKKKYEITFEKNGKKYVRKFGAAGMSDFTIHKDVKRRENYISRHKKDLQTGDPMRPGYLSMYILWNKPTLESSLKDYKKRLNIYNRTGEFPKYISGSKKLSKSKFGTKYKTIGEVLIDRIGIDPSGIISEDVAASDIQKIVRGKKSREYMKTKQFLKDRLLNLNIKFWKDKKRDHVEFAKSQMISPPGEPWLALDPTKKETVKWLYNAADILTLEDFRTEPLWVETIYYVVDEFAALNPDENKYGGELKKTLTSVEENLDIILDTMGHVIDFDEPGWYSRALAWIEEEYPIGGNAFGKSKIPDNVINKKLYETIKTNIRKSIKGRRWGAYDSGRLVREYKSQGGKYSGSKGKTNLDRWYREKWVDACAWPKVKPCGRKTQEKIAYCRPSKRIDSKTPTLVQDLTKKQIKSRCERKKKNPMKIITKFGQTQEMLDKIRIQMYKDIIKSGDVNYNIIKTIEKRCKRGFTDSFCQKIFTELLLSIYYTIVENSIITKKRRQNIKEMSNYIPSNFTPTNININKKDFDKVETFLYLLQDHSYGTFENARIASLIYEYIHIKN